MSAAAVMVPTPMFAKGDKVFYADTIMTKHSIECPDCGGTGKWPIKSPAGHDFTISCARCRYDYGFSEPELNLSWPTYSGYVKELTVGSVRIDTENHKPISYMCVETGVGSGSVYYEQDFYADRETAQKAADNKAIAASLSRKDVRTQALTSLPYVHLTYENAVKRAWEDSAQKIGRRIRGLLYDIENAEDMEEVSMAIQKFRSNEDED